jgi:hypothetical protein
MDEVGGGVMRAEDAATRGARLRTALEMSRALKRLGPGRAPRVGGVRRPHHFATVLSLLLAACSSILSPAEAQVLRGRVLDQRLGTPVLVGSVLLLDYTGEVEQIAITDSAGAFTLRLPDTGGFFGVRVDARGYATLVVPTFEVAPGESVEFDVLVGHSESRVDPESVRRFREPELSDSRRRRP